MDWVLPPLGSWHLYIPHLAPPACKVVSPIRQGRPGWDSSYSPSCPHVQPKADAQCVFFGWMKCFSVGYVGFHFLGSRDPLSESQITLIVLSLSHIIVSILRFAGDLLQESTCTREHLKENGIQALQASGSPFQGGLAVGIAGNSSIFPWLQQDLSGLRQVHGLAGQPHLSPASWTKRMTPVSNSAQQAARGSISQASMTHWFWHRSAVWIMFFSCNQQLTKHSGSKHHVREGAWSRMRKRQLQAGLSTSLNGGRGTDFSAACGPTLVGASMEGL